MLLPLLPVGFGNFVGEIVSITIGGIVGTVDGNFVGVACLVGTDVMAGLLVGTMSNTGDIVRASVGE